MRLTHVAMIKWYEFKIRYFRLMVHCSLEDQMREKLLDKMDVCSKKINRLREQ